MAAVLYWRKNLPRGDPGTAQLDVGTLSGGAGRRTPGRAAGRKCSTVECTCLDCHTRITCSLEAGMRNRRLPLMTLLGATSVALLCLATPMAGQRPAAPVASGAKATTSQKAWKAPRTAEGQPDLQGVWNFSTITPLERPTTLGAKDILNEDEAEEFE